MKIRSPMDAVELSRIRAIGEKVLQLQKQGKDIIRLQIGEPDFCTPNHIIHAANEAMEQGLTHYAPNRGLMTLQEALAGQCHSRRSRDRDSRNLRLRGGAVSGVCQSGRAG